MSRQPGIRHPTFSDADFASLSAGQLHPKRVSSFICWVLKLSSWDWLERQKKTKICLSPLCHGCVALTADEGKDYWRIRARPSSFVLMVPAVGGGWLSRGDREGYHACVHRSTHNRYRAGSWELCREMNQVTALEELKGEKQDKRLPNRVRLQSRD